MALRRGVSIILYRHFLYLHRLLFLHIDSLVDDGMQGAGTCFELSATGEHSPDAQLTDKSQVTLLIACRNYGRMRCPPTQEVWIMTLGCKLWMLAVME